MADGTSRDEGSRPPILASRRVTAGALLIALLLLAQTAAGAQPPSDTPAPSTSDPPVQVAAADKQAPQPSKPAPSEPEAGTMTAPESSGGTPPGTFSVEAFQTDLFTGAATAQIPIVVPAGAAGVAPKIALRYNSSTIDELQPRDQGQSTGLGWTLDVGGFILRDTKNTTGTSDDTFKLVFGGVAYDLVLVDSGQKIYHTKDETFLKLQYASASDSWTLTTKDGAQHRFGYNTDSKAITRGLDLTTAITYKYLLDQVTTTSGVAVQYTYTKQTGTIASNGQTYDQAVYPNTIRWAYAGGSLIGAAREVSFTWAARTDWTDTSATTVMSFFERSRLDSIEVRAGGGLVRRYLLGFDYSIDRDPAYTWGGGATGDLTLRTVTIYGTDGTSALPALSFAYTNARMSNASNGIGGTVSFGYERVTASTAIYRAVQAIQDDVNTYCGPGYYLSLSPDPFCGGTVAGYPVDTPVAGTSAPVYRAVAPVQHEFGYTCDGGYYLSPGPDPSCGGTVLGYLMDTPVAGTSAPLYRAVRPVQQAFGYTCDGGYYLSLSPDPSCGGTLLGYPYVASFDRFRVTARSVSDGRGGTSTLTFGYMGLGLSLSNDGMTKEFRGHTAVRAVDPLGHYTDTWFKQDDLMKGRPYHTQTRSSSGTLLAETTNTWATTSPYPGVTFVKLTQTDVATCDDAGGGCKTARQNFEYDAYGNPTRTYSAGDLAVTGDERDEYTDWVVDATSWLHRPTRTALYDASGTLLRERWLSYDGLGWGALGSRGLLTREERRLVGPRGTSGNPVVSSGYDAYGNRTSITDARGCGTTTVYETSRTYPATVTTCLGHATSFAFDARWGERTSETDPNGQTTTYTYDVFGRLTKLTGPLDGGSTYGSLSQSYLDFGNASAQRILTYRTTVHGTANAIWSDASFDGLGRVYLSRSQGPGTQTIQSETAYDARGLVAIRAVPHFSTDAATGIQFTYDARGRQTQALDPDGTSVRTAYAPGLVTITDQRGNVKRRYLDVYARLIRVEEVNGSETSATTYAYDASGALTRVTNHLNHVTTLTYDLLGRKTAMSDPNMGSWTYGYDLAGNLTSQTDARGQTLAFTYDLHGRVLTKTYPGGGQVQWTYDDPVVAYSKGRVTRIADLAVVTTFTYDALGRALQTRRLLDATTYTMSRAYDALGRVTSQTFPDGDTVTYSYNEAGWLAAVPGYVTSLTYNARGQQTQAQYANGVTTSWTYHATNFRLTGRVSTGSSQFQNFTYAYDAGGNLTQITDGLFTGGRTYTYDALNRLTAASGTFGSGQGQVTENYRYDGVGTILEKAGVLYSYSDPAHPAAVTARSGGSAYSYDANGNMLNGAGRTLTWDADNRLSAVTIQGGNSATFAYDASGLRARKTTASGTTRYPFAGYEIDPYGVVTKTFAGVAKKSSGAILFYHNDHLGGVHVITDASGARVQLVEYDPWGQVSRAEGSADPTHRFTGQELDPETGLYYYGGRYYDAVLARFVSADPFVPAPGNPQTLNRYSYVLNSPANYIDPSGYFFGKLWRAIPKWARGNEFLSTVIGMHLIALPSPAANLAGVSMVTATETGRTTLAASIVVGTAVATGYCLGCGAATGALVGELIGGYSAYASGGDVLAGVVVGGAAGATSGYLGGLVPTETGGFWTQVAKNFAAGAVRGAGIGAAAGFAGGEGSIEDILKAAAIAAALSGTASAGKVIVFGSNVTADPRVQEALHEAAAKDITVDLNAVTVRSGGALPLPGFAGITLGNTISIGPIGTDLSQLLAHELAHVVQWNAWGYARFIVQYLRWSAEYGYRTNPFERAAYDFQMYGK